MWTFRHFTSHWKKGEDWQQLANDDPRKPFILQLLYCCRFFYFDQGKKLLKLKIMESLLIARDKPLRNKAGSSLFLELFRYNISGYLLVFYHIIICLSIPLCICKCCFFTFHKQNSWTFNIILGGTMKVVAFES